MFEFVYFRKKSLMTLEKVSLKMHGKVTTVRYLPMAKQEVGSPTAWWVMETTRGLFRWSVRISSRALKPRGKRPVKMMTFRLVLFNNVTKNHGYMGSSLYY